MYAKLFVFVMQRRLISLYFCKNVNEYVMKNIQSTIVMVLSSI